jgi:hypothetical protein
VDPLLAGRDPASIEITSFEDGYGKGRHSTASTMLKIAVFAPLPSASASSATAVNPGCRRSMRTPKPMSWRNPSHMLPIPRSASPIGGSGRPCAARSQRNVITSRSECCASGSIYTINPDGSGRTLVVKNVGDAGDRLPEVARDEP